MLTAVQWRIKEYVALYCSMVTAIQRPDILCNGMEAR